jgi:predicted dehydrogenase
MNQPSQSVAEGATRRQFLQTSTALAAGAAVAGLARPGYTQESNTLKVALVGCGGRGTGAAAQALSTPGPVKLVAMADVFEARLERSHKNLSERLADKMDVPAERRFTGLDAYRHAIEAVGPGGVVLFATAPAFRPQHFEYAVQRGCHCFVEKSFAVDGPGIRRFLQAGELAKQKNLKVAGGLMCRHNSPLEAAIQQIHDGLIGDVITCWAYRMHGPVGMSARQPGQSELAHQIANYSNFTWLNGSFIVDWLIHNIDVCCWVKNTWPESVQGMGGRQVRKDPDQLFDHYAAEYSFPDGTRLFAQGRHITKCFDFFGSVIHGTKGCAVLGEGIPKPRLFKGHKPLPENLLWQYKGTESDPYQNEHNLFFDAIRTDKPYNEAERCAKSCLTAICGRIACETGSVVTYEQALNSQVSLAPGLDQLTMDAPAPVRADASGQYPIAMPGTQTVPRI